MLVGSAASASAVEDDDVQVDQVAREHYRRGEAAFKAGRFDEAYRHWEEGYRLSSRPLFLVNMAHAQRRRGELRNARSLYQRFLLVEPQTKMRRELETVIREIDSTLGVEPGRRPPSEPAAPGTPPAAGGARAGDDASAGLAPPPLGTPGSSAPAATASAAPAPAETPAVVPPPVAPPPLPLGRPALAPPPEPPSLIDRPGEGARPSSQPPIYKRWWFWAGTGGVVAAGLAAVFLLRSAPYTRSGSLGTIGIAP
jgi:hypothetical protein